MVHAPQRSRTYGDGLGRVEFWYVMTDRFDELIAEG